MDNRYYMGNNLIPEDGETITIIGGLGDRVIEQRMRENGNHYKRSNEKQEWIKYDINEDVMNSTINMKTHKQIKKSKSIDKRIKRSRKLKRELESIPLVSWILFSFFMLLSISFLIYGCLI